MVLSKKRITKALIRLRRCAGWSAPVLFANPEDRFSRVAAHIVHTIGPDNRVRTEMGEQNSRTFAGLFQDFFSFFKDSISSQFCIKQ